MTERYVSEYLDDRNFYHIQTAGKGKEGRGGWFAMYRYKKNNWNITRRHYTLAGKVDMKTRD